MTAPMFLFCGMLYERETVPSYLRWMQDLSLVNYSYATYIINEAR
jgi:ABC-type multidrug transport system permease subunit